VSGGLTPVINPSTNYEQQPDGSYGKDRGLHPGDNPTFEHAERCWPHWKARAAPGAVRVGDGGSHRRLPVPAPGYHVLVSRVLYWECANGWPLSALTWAWTWNSPTPPIPACLRRRSAPADQAAVGGDSGEPMWEITDLAAVCELAPWRRCGWRSTTRWPPGADPAVRAPRGPGGAFGHPSISTATATCWPVRCWSARRDPFWERSGPGAATPARCRGPFEAWLLHGACGPCSSR